MQTNFAAAAKPTEPGRLSFSSVQTYSECGEKWRLERLYGVRSSTWFATVAGSALHEMTEHYDRGDLTADEAVDCFQDVFDGFLDKEQERGPIEVKPSGKVLKNSSHAGGPNKKDYDWWLEFGPTYMQAWIDWRAANPHLVIATMPDGSPAIEVEVDSDMGGDANKGFIDRVFLDTSANVLIVVDLKFGNDPASSLQLGDYRVKLKRQYDMTADLGAFWSGQKGDLGYQVDLTAYSESFIENQYEMAWRGIRAGVFMPNPTTSHCRTCDGAPFCRAIGGRDAQVFPVRTLIQPRGEGVQT